MRRNGPETRGGGGGHGLLEVLGVFCTVLVVGQLLGGALMLSTGQLSWQRCERAIAVLFSDDAPSDAFESPETPVGPVLTKGAKGARPVEHLARDPQSSKLK